MGMPGSGLGAMLGGVGNAAEGIGSLISSVGNLLPTTTTTTTSGQTNKATSQLMLDDDAINRMLAIIMQANDGLQSVASGERTAGIFNSTTNQQLVNDLMVRAAGQVAIAAAPTQQTQEVGPTKTKQKSSKGCFITSAICEYRGNSDDCAELTTLRAFRDGWMIPNGYTEELIDYYDKAPIIVDTINSYPQLAELMWGYLYHRYISPAVQNILAGEYEKAFSTYKEMVGYAEGISKKLLRV